jgi:hypothetical protein
LKQRRWFLLGILDRALLIDWPFPTKTLAALNPLRVGTLWRPH